MTQKEFLAKLHLTTEEFRDLVDKYTAFKKLLTPTQGDAVQRSLPTLAKAVKSFGPDVTPDELIKVVTKTLGKRPVHDDDGGTFGSNIVAVNRSPIKPKKSS